MPIDFLELGEAVFHVEPCCVVPAELPIEGQYAFPFLVLLAQPGVLPRSCLLGPELPHAVVGILVVFLPGVVGPDVGTGETLPPCYPIPDESGRFLVFVPTQSVIYVLCPHSGLLLASYSETDSLVLVQVVGDLGLVFPPGWLPGSLTRNQWNPYDNYLTS